MGRHGEEGGARRSFRAGPIAGDWAASWRSRRENPLPAYWRTAAHRAEERRPWWRRRLGLMLIGLLLSLSATGLLLLQLTHLLKLRGNPVATPAYAASIAALGTTYLASFALVLAMVWLLSRVYQAAHFALGLLGGDGRDRSGAGLDDALAASPLRPTEIVVALLLHGLNLLRPPVLAISLLSGVLVLLRWSADSNAHLLDLSGGLTELWRHGWPGALAAAGCGSAWQFGCGMLGGALLLLLLTGLGAAPRAGIVPATGALVWTIHEGVLTVGGMMIAIADARAVGYSFGDYVLFSTVPMLQEAVVWEALLAVTLISARWHDGLRQFAVYGGACMFGYILVLVQSFQSLNAGEEIAALGLTATLWAGELFGLANLGHLAPGLAAAQGWGDWLNLALRWPVLLALQLVLLPVLAGFAWRAVQRRREGER